MVSRKVLNLPKIAILITTLNRKDLLEESLTTLLPDSEHFERLIILDNGRQGIEVDHPKVSVFEQKKSMHAAESWNYGLTQLLEVTDCDHMLVLHDDVALRRGQLESIRMQLRDEPGYWLYHSTHGMCSFVVHRDYLKNSTLWFDTGFNNHYHDYDFRYRLWIAEAERVKVLGALNPRTYRRGSSMTKTNGLRESRTKSRERYTAKWGGRPDQEQYTVSFNADPRAIRLNIVTPCCRPERLKAVMESLLANPDKLGDVELQWYIGLDSSQISEDKIAEIKGWESCWITVGSVQHPDSDKGNAQRNWCLDAVEDQHDGDIKDFVYFVDDDNIMHSDFYEHVVPVLKHGSTQGILFDTQTKGGRILFRAGEDTPIKARYTDTAQIVVASDVIGDIRWVLSEVDHPSDGVFAEATLGSLRHGLVYLDKQLGYHNYQTPETHGEKCN